MSVAEGDLLVEDADVAVGLAVERDRNAGIVDAVLLAVADAEEGGAVGVDLPVEAEVALVGVVGEGDLNGVVVGGEAGGGEAGQRKRARGVGAARQELRTELLRTELRSAARAD